MRTIKKGATSQSIYFDILDSTSTTGGRKTGLAFDTASLVAYYVRNQNTAVSITLATLAAANTAWSSGGFKEVDATNMPGIYRLDVPDAAFATGADSVAITLKGATGMVQASYDVQLVSIDPQDAVRAGLTALPNAAAEAAGGLYTRGTGAGQINQDANGRVDSNTKAWAGTATTLTSGLPDVNMKTITAGIIAAASFASGALDAVWSTATRLLTAGTNIVLAKGTGITGFNDISAAQVNAEADTAIADAALATAANLATVAGYIDTEIGTIITNLATVDTVVDAIKGTTDKLDDTMEDDGGTFRFTANALEEAPTGGGAPTAEEIADEVQTRTIAAVTTVNGLAANSVTAAALAADAGTEIGTAVWATTTRLLTAGTNIALAKGTGVTGFNDLSAAQVNAEADAALADAGVTTTVTGRIDAAISTRLASAGYTAPDNAGITAVKAKTDNLPSDPADQSLIIAATDAVMGRLGAPAGASVSADVAAVKADSAAVKAKTDDLTFTVPGAVDANVSHVNEVEVIGTGETGDEWGPTP